MGLDSMGLTSFFLGLLTGEQRQIEYSRNSGLYSTDYRDQTRSNCIIYRKLPV